MKGEAKARRAPVVKKQGKNTSKRGSWGKITRRDTRWEDNPKGEASTTMIGTLRQIEEKKKKKVGGPLVGEKKL